MLTKPKRLTRNDDIVAVMRQGQVIDTEHIRFHFRAAATPTSRAAVVVSKKISKLAVLRNRYKRMMREVVKQVINELEGKTYDMVLIAKPSINGVKKVDELAKTFLPKINEELTN